MTVVWGWRSRGGGSRRERGRREFRGRRMWLFGGQAGVSEGVERGGRGGGGLVRQRIMKVAKDWERFPIAMLGRLVSVVRLRLKEGFAAGVYPQASKANYVCAAGRSLRFGFGKLYLSRLLFELEE